MLDIPRCDLALIDFLYSSDFRQVPKQSVFGVIVYP